ncbi:MAG: plasmid mobilization protein, partial [Thiolinea sp.]
ATLCDMSLAAYSRALTLGHTPKSNVEQQQFTELAHLHGDLGRLGGLLKLWLSDHTIKAQGKALHIDELINDIRSTQIVLKQKARELSNTS